jgi:phosphonate degradation associated HDIG domain protein
MTVDEIIGLYESRGARTYRNEPISQLEHALQCAALARAANAAHELVAAAFLHDLGHLVTQASIDSVEEIDDLHQYVAIPFLRRTFADAVTEPIRLHVDAKRLLSCAESGYLPNLSAASRRGVELRGGAFSRVEAEFFLARPHAWDAVQLRRWDDLAKTPGKPTRPLGEMRALLHRLEA